MSDQSKQAESTDPRVEAALREYLERVDRGEAVNREEFLSRHSEIADAVRSFFAAEEPLRKIAATKLSNESAATSTQSIAAQGQETVPPKLQPGGSLGTTGSGLAEKFGRYQIIRALGKGAMGTVYLAEDTQIERQVALKTPHFTEDPTGEQMERFFREARAAGNLRHPNICPIYDFGQIDGKHFITMAYIEGRPLSAYIQLDNQQPERQILLLVRKLASALQEAHDHGVVHRDLKPANIMVDKKGEPMIMDFGLAQQTRPNEDVRLTQTGNILGTPAFMSPEQVEGEPDKIGPPSDQYSLGVILYELLTAQLPFRGSVMAVMGQILTKEPPPPSQLRPDLDPRIEAVCRKMMAKNPAERFRSLKAAADEISRILKSPAAKTASKEPPLSSPASSPAGDRRQADAGASQVLKSLKQKAVTESDLASLEELARKCYSRRDFEQVIQIIERVPEKCRNAALQALLEKSRGKADEISFLICDIDEAVRLNDRQRALKKAEELLKIKPGHHRALKVQEEFAGYGEGGAARIGLLKQFTQPWNEGGWIPWSVLAFGLAVFGVMAGVIIVWLGKTAIVIDTQVAGITVTANGESAVVTVPGMQSIKVEPGDQTLTISYAGLETKTKTFTIKKGQTKIVTVSILNSEIVARLEGEIAPPTPDQQKTTAATLPPTFKSSLGMEFVLVPKGKSWLGGGGGSPGGKEVVIDRDFYLGRYEVTQDEWKKVTGFTPSFFSRTGGGTDIVKGIADAQLERFPVDQVSWDDVQAFLERLNKAEKETGWVYRLPNASEWEYACRGGPLSDKFESAYDFYFDKPTNQLLPEQANFGNSKGLKRTCKVGSYKPNRLGLYDMHGNVDEWCDDAWKASDGGSRRVHKGGAWTADSGLCRAAEHFADPASDRGNNLGFRVARVPVGERGASHSADVAKQAGTAMAKPNSPQLLVSPFDEATAKKGQEAWAGHFKRRVELSNAIGMKLVLIPPGEFQMGSTDPQLPADVRPVHRVRITKPFYLGIYEVTQEEYQRIMDANPSEGRGDPRLPVESMSGENIQDFCRKLSAMPEEKQAGRTYRVPTEAEWEYACRAGTTTRFHFGDVMSSDQANFDGENPGVDLPRGPKLGRTTKVGSYRPNAFGLYDMHGNVIEVVSDSYSADYYSTSPVDDPKGPTSGNLGVGRGGGWHNVPIPSAYRYAGPRSTIDTDLGFRVVCNMAVLTASASAADDRKAFGRPFLVQGDWKVENDELVQPTLATGWWRDLNPLIVFGKESLSNYDLTLEAKKTGGSGVLGVFFHWLRPGNYRYFNFGNVGIDFGYLHDGKWGREASNWKALSFSSNRWYALKVKVRGDTYWAYLDGALQFAQTDTRFASGRICLSTDAATAQFRRIKVSDPQGKVLFEGLPELPPASNKTTPKASIDNSFRSLTAAETAAKSDQQRWAERLKMPVISTNSLGIKLALIPPGEFQMGSPQSERDRRGDEQQHRVRITKPYYLGVYEVTQSDFEQLMGRNPSLFQNTGGQAEAATGPDTSRYPVEHVTWYDAVEFCNKLSEKEGLQPYYRIAAIERDPEGWIKDAKVSVEGAGGYHLPTEAQWEYACRAGTTTPFNFGTANNGVECNCYGKLPYGTEEQGSALGRTVPVGSYRPNAFGLYDMHGNAREWCWDLFDPAGPSGGALRTWRGGGMLDSAGECRAAARFGGAPGNQGWYDSLGFRVARVPVGKEVGKFPPKEKKAVDVVPGPPAVAPKADLATTAPREDAASTPFDARDPFQPKSIWFSDEPRLVLTVTDRKGAIFRARFEVGTNITRMIKGTVKDGKVDWFAKDVRAIRGKVGDDNHGTIASDDLGDKIDFVWGLHGTQKGKFTLRLRK